jgi:hypothetical protein
MRRESLKTLDKIAEATGKRVKIEFVAVVRMGRDPETSSG